MIPHHHDDDEKDAVHHDLDNLFDGSRHHHHNKKDHSDIPYLKHSAEFGNGIIKTEAFSVSYAKTFPAIDADLPIGVELVILQRNSLPRSHRELQYYHYLSNLLYSCRSLRAPPFMAPIYS